MKKRSIALFCLFLSLISFSACSTPKESGSTSSALGGSVPQAAGEIADDANRTGSETAESKTNAGPGTVFSTPQTGALADKIIYTAEAVLETRAFSGTLDKIEQEIKRLGGFTESAAVKGSRAQDAANESAGYRSAVYVLRVPRAAYDQLIKNLSSIGSMVSFTSGAKNITSEFTDTQARQAAYQTEEKRLLSLLDKAESMEDILTIEKRLSEVRYQIEALTSQLNNWQNQVDYSTVTIRVIEVASLSDSNPLPHTYWGEVYAAIRSSCLAVYHFFQGLLKYALAAVPILILPAAALWIGGDHLPKKTKGIRQDAARQNGEKAVRLARPQGQAGQAAGYRRPNGISEAIGIARNAETAGAGRPGRPAGRTGIKSETARPLL